MSLRLFFDWLDSKIAILMDMGLRTFAWWLVMGMAVCVSGVIPAKHPVSGRCIAFFLIAFLHICINMFEPHILTLRRKFPDAGPSGSSDPDDIVKKRTETTRASKPEMHERNDCQRNG